MARYLAERRLIHKTGQGFAGGETGRGCGAFCSASRVFSALQEPFPFHDLITPLTEPGQALQSAPIRTVLPRFARLPAPFR